MTSAVPIINLIPLDDAEQAAFIAAELADDVELRMATSDVTEADARQAAHAELLPVLEREHREVVHSTDRQFTALNAEGQSVGWLWARFPESPVNSAYLYQITVPAEHRRKSYGFAMLQALDVLLTNEGRTELCLHVNEGNHQARRLYARAGYNLREQANGKLMLCKRLAEPAFHDTDGKG